MAILKKKQKSRNPELVRGINRYGRRKSASKNFIHFKKGANNKSHTLKRKAEKKAEAEKKKPATKWYPTEDVKKPIPSRKSHHKPTRLRPSIVPGTILIILTGRFRGKRVIFLKQLTSGLLLVTGPYKINGVPLRRINQRYVISTSTRVPVSGVDVSKLDDGFFAKSVDAAKKKKKEGEEFFNDSQAKKSEVSSERKAEQKKIDTQLITHISKDLKHYLNAKFSLTNGQKPHALKF
jgi:large subunit ribosomal protein L6e